MQRHQATRTPTIDEGGATRLLRRWVIACGCLCFALWQPVSAQGQQAPPPDEEDTTKSEDADAPEAPREETWVQWGANKRDQKWEASTTEVLARDPRNWVAGEELHPGWIPVPGMPIEFRFGGFIQLNLIHDFQNAGVPSGEFVPSLIPVPTDFTPNTEFDVRTTRFIFESRTRAKNTWVNVFLSMDFNNTQSGTSHAALASGVLHL